MQTELNTTITPSVSLSPSANDTNVEESDIVRSYRSSYSGCDYYHLVSISCWMVLEKIDDIEVSLSS